MCYIIAMFKSAKLYIFSFMFITSTSYGFMSGVKPELDGGAALEIIDAVIHMAPPNSPVNAGYGVIKNNTNAPIELTTFRSPVFDELQIHEMKFDSDGTAKMIKLEKLTIPAKGMVSLEPGGNHIMLINKRRELKMNEKVLVVTIAADEVRYMLKFKVIDPRSSGGASHHDHHMH